jgi:hypothetical protein
MAPDDEIVSKMVSAMLAVSQRSRGRAWRASASIQPQRSANYLNNPQNLAAITTWRRGLRYHVPLVSAYRNVRKVLATLAIRNRISATRERIGINPMCRYGSTSTKINLSSWAFAMGENGCRATFINAPSLPLRRATARLQSRQHQLSTFGISHSLG